MKISIKYQYYIPLLVGVLLAASCSKTLETEPKSVLTEANMYRNVYDADAAVIGLYGKFMNLAEPYVVLNEMRADLMTTTTNSNEYLKQLNEHSVKEDNPYANPRPFYEVILNCNDIMYNLDFMLRDKKLKVDEYNQRYSDVATLRCWVYLQLGIHFGKVPYVTNPLPTTADVASITQMTFTPFAGLLDSLTKKMESLPYLQQYSTSTSLVTTVDAYATGKFFVNKQVLLGQLYLWRNDYNKAAVMFKKVMETAGTGSLYNYRLTGASKGDNNDVAVGYYRYRELDENMLVNNNSQGWRSLFARSQDNLFNYEWVWFLPFDKSFNPTDPFINLFSNRGGSYLAKPSQYAIDSTWNNQKQKNDFTYDARGKMFTWKSIDNQPVIMKYLYNFLDETSFLPVNVFQKSGKWFLYRAAALHLEYAEAINRDNHKSLAYALLNQGLTTIPNRITNESAPYDFDSRKTDVPKVTGDWSLNSGIRGRANLYSMPATIAAADSVIAIEDALITESGLELAYEGKRWSDLLRIALRRNDPSYLADKIYKKLLGENNPQAATVRTKLLDPANWYLPFKLK